MSTEVVVQEGIVGTVAKYTDQVAWDDVVAAGSYLPRIQLFGGNSDACKESKIGMGRWGLVLDKDNIIDLGAGIDVFAYRYRFKAMRLSGGQVLSYYNPTSPEFEKVRVDSENNALKCMYGPEFLLWLPSQKRFVTYFASSKSSRRDASKINIHMQAKERFTLKVALASNAKYKWHAPVTTPCTTPFDMPEAVEEINKQIERFCNPKESEVEAVDPATAAGVAPPQ